MVVQWLRLQAPNAGGPGSIPGQGSRSHMPQLRGHMQQLKPGTVKGINKMNILKKKANKSRSLGPRNVKCENK